LWKVVPIGEDEVAQQPSPAYLMPDNRSKKCDNGNINRTGEFFNGGGAGLT